VGDGVSSIDEQYRVGVALGGDVYAYPLWQLDPVDEDTPLDPVAMPASVAPEPGWELVGINLGHKAGDWCVCTVLFDDEHDATSHRPLTITGTITCPACGLEGAITEGRWEPAP
jgi:hypothetical protein